MAMKPNPGNVMGVALLMMGVWATGPVTAGNLDPTNAPGPTMHTLDEIYHKLETMSAVGGIVMDRNLHPLQNPLNFGGIVTGSTTTVMLEIANLGDFPTTITGLLSSDPVFSGSWEAWLRPIGAPYFTYLTFTPSNPGGYSATITLQANNTTGTNQITCVGTGIVTRFVDNGDGTVTDNATGLMWTKNANHGLMDVSNAVTYCSTLDYAGYQDWRLPSVETKEFSSTTVKYKFLGKPEINSLGHPGGIPYANPYTMPGAPFTNVQSDFYAVSATNAANYYSDTEFAFHMNGDYVNSAGGPCYVWPVRGP